MEDLINSGYTDLAITALAIDPQNIPSDESLARRFNGTRLYSIQDYPVADPGDTGYKVTVVVQWREGTAQKEIQLNTLVVDIYG